MHTVRSEVAGAEESISGRTTGRLKKVASAVALAMMSAVGPAQAEPIIFNFNCALVNATTCTPGQQLASMTLSDSTLNRNHVDIDLAILGGVNITGFNKLYLNYRGTTSVHGGYFSLASQTSWIGFGQEDLNASVTDSVGPFGSGMDIVLGLPQGLLGAVGLLSSDFRALSASLVFRNDMGPYGEGDLDAVGFQTKDVNNLIYAALEMSTPTGTVYAGATVAYNPSDVLPIGNINLTPPPDVLSPPDLTEPSGALIQANLPEPGTFGLLGVAAGFLAFVLGFNKRRRA
jgi:hypothetical protein